ncbi:MAG: FixH family protein [Rhodospirillaceae bacterium]|jgi:nitrogen fixation protein FixH|nr:FixH family protein [Rhodospirillaceae bacterium]
MSLAFYNENRPVTGRSVLWWVISFFVVIFIANFAFVYFALSSWPGLSTENAYEKGVRYNETIAKAEAQSRLGWQSSVALSDNGELVITLTDKEDQMLSGRVVKVDLVRPIQEGVDQQVTLAEARAGIYRAPVKFTHLGRWWIDVSVGEQYSMRHELQVK